MTTERFDLRSLRVPVVQAPMAGGPSTPELTAAVSERGALGFLAAGYRAAETLRDDIARTRSLTTRPFGVNLFVPVPSAATPASIEAYRAELVPTAARYGVQPGQPRADDDGWHEKLAIVEQTAPAIVSFTFGLPDADTIARLQQAGSAVAATITTLEELHAARAARVDVLVVQGPEAGGHRGTFDPTAEPDRMPLDALLAVVSSNTRLPVIAAGGLAKSADVERVLNGGAAAAQAGTAFLRAAEAGTRPAHADALASGAFTETAVTRAFSGRYARGLVNDFLREHDASAPFGYPEVNQLTGPIRAAAAAAGDPQALNLWAGVSFRRAVAGTAAEIVELLSP